MVMTSSRRDIARRLNTEFPGRVGLLLTPGDWRDPQSLPYALDNGRFAVWSKGAAWSEGDFLSHLDKAAKTCPPLWLAIPDVVANAGATFVEWKRWHPTLKKYGWPLALVVQDGMTCGDVLGLTPAPDLIFVGGTTTWKWRTLSKWCRAFPRVHVGRVNTKQMLWAVQRVGAESSDGTGWWHHKQRRDLADYLKKSGEGQGDRKVGFFF